MDERPGTRPEELTAREARALIRAGEWTGPTAGLAPGYVQANLVVLPGDFAPDFARFCRANPRALPLLDVTEPGSPTPARVAPESDVRLDLPRYRVYREGRTNEEPTDIVTLWHADFVAFLIGCSFTFDALLRANGVAVRHLELGRNVPMYVTNRKTEPAGRFSGPLVVSMRPIRRDDVDRVVELTRDLRIRPGEQPKTGSPKELGLDESEFPCHGEPVHIGSPEALGIEDLERPDYGDAVPVRGDEVPAFWACGVTAQAAAERSRVPLMITHAPGHMFITDLAVHGVRPDGEPEAPASPV
jgi:uncharacterized protein YcsI (UPF0317 family)